MQTPKELTRVDIRSVWAGEARDFTPWLADHLEVLGTHLGVGELALEATEVRASGGRSLDLLALDADGGKWAIENQFGSADHDHLTRALAYAVALRCRAVVLIAEDHRDEFVAVADEWNRYAEAFGDAGIRVFLAVVEAFRIGDSAPGFRFRLAASPNEWTIATTASAARSAAEGQRQEANLAFWTAFLPIANERTTAFRSITPRTGPYLSSQTGVWHVQVWVLSDACRVQIRLDGGNAEDSEALFERLRENATRIDAAFGAPLDWDPTVASRACHVRHEVEGSVGWKSPREEWRAGMERTADALARLQTAMEPYLAEL